MEKKELLGRAEAFTVSGSDKQEVIKVADFYVKENGWQVLHEITSYFNFKKFKTEYKTVLIKADWKLPDKEKYNLAFEKVKIIMEKIEIRISLGKGRGVFIVLFDIKESEGLYVASIKGTGLSAKGETSDLAAQRLRNKLDQAISLFIDTVKINSIITALNSMS
jgi:hypothetical protein